MTIPHMHIVEIILRSITQQLLKVAVKTNYKNVGGEMT